MMMCSSKQGEPVYVEHSNCQYEYNIFLLSSLVPSKATTPRLETEYWLKPPTIRQCLLNGMPRASKL